MGYAKLACEKCGKLVTVGYRANGYNYLCKKCYKSEKPNNWLDSVIKLEAK